MSKTEPTSPALCVAPRSASDLVDWLRRTFEEGPEPYCDIDPCIAPHRQIIGLLQELEVLRLLHASEKQAKIERGDIIAELEPYKARMLWLHDCSTGCKDPQGYEWGIFRVKWENGQAVEVWQTNSDFSDLDAEMARELSSPNDRNQPRDE